ncbi:MAG: DUF481 domain-containing protein [Myxococcales bacterium]|nr:DUF481 domain-containing protein [Myxococcota bacterium]MDW8281328.1 DUF481 domain-containing protein [Myxococcales bacterium]
MCTQRIGRDVILIWLLCSGVAQAQPTGTYEPKFSYVKPEEAQGTTRVEWKAAASAGLSYAAGNANMLTLSGGGNLSRNDGKNKIALQVEGIYGLTWLRQLGDLNGNGVIDADDEVVQVQQTTAGFLLGTFRYDRFFTPRNTLYITTFAGLDWPASKQALVGLQAGYGRLLVKTKAHELLGEAGIDYGYTNYRAPDPIPDAFVEHVHLGAARLFVGYNVTIRDNTTLASSLEALINLNPATIGDRAVGPAQATRLNGKVSLTTQLWKKLNLRAAFGLRYDHTPGLNTQLKFAQSYTGPLRYNQPLDMLTELSLVVTFL